MIFYKPSLLFKMTKSTITVTYVLEQVHKNDLIIIRPKYSNFARLKVPDFDIVWYCKLTVPAYLA